MSQLMFDSERLCWQVAEHTLLQLKRQHAQLFDIVSLMPERCSEYRTGLSTGLKKFLNQHEAECRLLEPPADSNWRKILLSLGLNSYQKLLYNHDLTQPLGDPELNFELESLASIGESAFIEDLERAFEGDPENDHQAPDWNAKAEFQELKAHADSAFDAHKWFRVSYQQTEIGMLLPQVYADKPSEGTVFYLGVFAEQRQQGYGRALHLLGLRQLQSRGASRYLGSTHASNLGMQAIFKANGCEQIRLLTFFKP